MEKTAGYEWLSIYITTITSGWFAKVPRHTREFSLKSTTIQSKSAYSLRIIQNLVRVWVKRNA